MLNPSFASARACRPLPHGTSTIVAGDGTPMWRTIKATSAWVASGGIAASQKRTTGSVKKVLYQSEGTENCEVIVIPKANGRSRLASVDAPNKFNRPRSYWRSPQTMTSRGLLEAVVTGFRHYATD